MNQMSIANFALLLLFLASNVKAQPGVFNIKNYAAPNGDITNALKSAWKEACASPIPSKVLVPSGSYFLHQIDLEGPCNSSIEVEVQGTIQAPKDPYHLNGEDKWIRFQYVDFFTLSGSGTFDGNGEMAWVHDECAKKSVCNMLAMNFGFSFLNNSVIKDINSLDSKYFHANVFGCINITFSNFNIKSPDSSRNTDGIHIGRSTKVKIIDSKIATGDDCISLGDGSKKVTVQNVTCGPGHGISVGSLGRYPNEESVVDLTVKNCTLNNTDNGLRIKTWPGTSVVTFVSHMHFEDIIMVNVTNPVIIDQEYCPWNQCSKETPSKITIKKVLFKNIKGTSSTKEGVTLICSSGVPCKHVVLSNVDLSFNGSEVTARCVNVTPKMRKKAPICATPSQLGPQVQK